MLGFVLVECCSLDVFDYAHGCRFGLGSRMCQTVDVVGTRDVSEVNVSPLCGELSWKQPRDEQLRQQYLCH